MLAVIPVDTQRVAVSERVSSGMWMGRVRALSQNVKSLALEDVYRRVAGLLMRLATPEGSTHVVRDRLTQRDIAERIGSSREMVSRIFKELTVGGYVEVRAGVIFVLRKLPPAR
jgi:CRP/FNR family transcriptional regulator, cyclic AMP receptor protein